MNYRNAALLGLARLLPCCQSCSARNVGQVVAAHANGLGKGMALKAPDWAWAGLCDRCHFEIDQGARLSRAERWEVWLDAYWKTVNWMWISGHVNVVPASTLHLPEPKPRDVRKVRKGPKMQSRPFAGGAKQSIPSKPFAKKKARPSPGG